MMHLNSSMPRTQLSINFAVTKWRWKCRKSYNHSFYRIKQTGQISPNVKIVGKICQIRQLLTLKAYSILMSQSQMEGLIVNSSWMQLSFKNSKKRMRYKQLTLRKFLKKVGRLPGPKANHFSKLIRIIKSIGNRCCSPRSSNSSTIVWARILHRSKCFTTPWKAV